ncbi:hypothetical protein MMC07_008703 [Pseudocyphellaria aurata]|nr:hypothetical protein [Pseudocyphellaria aurata]
MPANRNNSAPPAGSASSTGSAAPTRRGRRANPIGPPPRLPLTRINRGQNRRIMVNDEDQQPGANDAYITLREAQQEETRRQLKEAQQQETRLRKKAEQAAEDEEERTQEEAELIATRARLKQLQAQKAEREARQGTTTLSVIEGPQSQSGSTLRQGEKTLVSAELFRRYPAIDEMHSRAIKENTFKLINVVKLTTEMALEKNKVKLLAVGSEVAVEAKEEDVLLGELRGLPYLI